MKTLAALLFVVLAFSAFADGTQAVLTTDGSVYTVAAGSKTRLELVKRTGEDRVNVLVPGTDDDAVESQAKLLWDNLSASLFVVWHRQSASEDQILLARLHENEWCEPIIVAEGNLVKRVGLEVVLSRQSSTTFVHAAWWSMNNQPYAEYALLAFENGQNVSSFTMDLETLAGANSISSIELDVSDAVLHPPLAMARIADGVDVVFGKDRSTAVTRVRIHPRLAGNARIWKPVGRSGENLPNARLASNTYEPVQAMINNGRVILYTPESKFRFVVYENGHWSPQRMIQVDGEVTSERLIRELKETIEQLAIDEAPQPVRQ